MVFWDILANDIPWEIVTILSHSGYDSIFSLYDIDEKEICIIEQSMGKKFETLLEKSEIYSHWKSPEGFSFLPGHKKTIIQLGKRAKLVNESKDNTNDTDMTEIPFILKEMMNCFKMNKNVAPTRRRYSEPLRHFSIYIFILCGKAGYDVLSHNLPLPDSSTICKLNHK